jgi:hypothetical protein
MLKRTSLLFLIFLIFIGTVSGQISEVRKTSQCQLFYVTKSDLSKFKVDGQPIQSLSYSVNQVLKKSFDFVNTLDHYTLGFASAITLGLLLKKAVSLEDIKPNAWNEVTLNGRLLYRDSPFTLLPVRAAKIKISFEKNNETLLTGSQGEYAGFFYKWISYDRFRLFPNPIFERKQKNIKTIDIPFDVEIESKFCHASMKITKLPLEPITFIMSDPNQF